MPNGKHTAEIDNLKDDVRENKRLAKDNNEMLTELLKDSATFKERTQWNRWLASLALAVALAASGVQISGLL